MYVFGFHVHSCVLRFTRFLSLSLSLSFWFSPQLLTSQLWIVHLCTVHESHKLHFLETFSLKRGLTALFTHSKIISLKNYFATMFSVSAKIRFIQTDPFLSVPNLSFNQLVGLIPYIKLFGTFLEASYERNKGLCGCLLKITTSNIWRYSLILRAFDWLELPKCRAGICIWLWDDHCAAYILEEVETGEYNIYNTLIIFFFKIFPQLYLENMSS